MKRLMVVMLMLGTVAGACTNREVLFEDNFIMRLTVKRGPGKYETTNNLNVYVNRQSISWANRVIYARLVDSTTFDNTTAVPTLCSESNPFPFQSQNDFCYKNSSATYTRSDPLNPSLGIVPNIFTQKPIHSAFAPLGTGESSQTIALLDFYGVKEGVYDLIAWADIETSVEVDNNICTCTRTAGCSPEDYEIYQANKAGGLCNTLQDISGQPMPSNGDVFYAIDNIVVKSETESRLTQLSLKNDGDILLHNLGEGQGDQDVWDEWRCIYHISAMTGFSLHDYTFPKDPDPDPNKSKYCLPNSACLTAGTKTNCGTMMDFGTDYDPY